MYLNSDETKKVYSIVARYIANENDSIDYDYGIGVSSVFKANNEVEFLYKLLFSKYQLLSQY